MNISSSFCVIATLSMSVWLGAPTGSYGVPVPGAEVQVWDWDEQGAPTLVVGELGSLGPGEPASEAARFLADFVRRLGGGVAQRGVQWMALRTWEDDLGTLHVRLRPRIFGLPVAGAEVVVHAEVTSGQVYAIGGTMLLTPPPSRNPRLPAVRALVDAAYEVGLTRTALAGAPALSYVLRESDGRVVLAWRSRIHDQRAAELEVEELFADASRGGLVARHRWVHHGARRQREHELVDLAAYSIDFAASGSTNAAVDVGRVEQVFAQLAKAAGLGGDALGLDRTSAVATRALRTYLTPAAGRRAMRHAMVLAATDLYGAASPAVDAVHQAWCAVGIGDCEPLQACWRINALAASWRIHPAGDLDGDGNDELFLRDPDTGAGVVAGAGHWGGLRTERTSSAPTGQRDVVAAGDLNGDGRHEVFLYDRTAGHGMVYARQGLEDYGEVWSTDRLRTTWEVYPAGDLDGDGRAELFLYDRIAGDGEVFALKKEGGYETVWRGRGLRTTWQVHPAGDLDGDGRAELFLYDPEDGAGLLFGHRGPADLELDLGLEAGTYPSASAVIPLGDVNGDGSTELLLHDTARGVGGIYGRQ